jgi:hypothetical protein
MFMSSTYHPHSIIEAVETLSSIADLEFEGPIAVIEKHEVVIQQKHLKWRSIHWLHKDNADKVVLVAKETFRTILGYLKGFYRREVGKLSQHESVDGIKMIMTLVAEAAKKLDRFTNMRHLKDEAASVKQSREFQELVAFYSRKIAPIAAQESLIKSVKMLPIQAVLAATKKPVQKAPLGVNHLFMDLESVKNDIDYELFLIRKEDGSRFFNPRLLRNVKLVSHFEEYLGENTQTDLQNNLKQFQEKQALASARNILRRVWPELNEFAKNASCFRDSEFVGLMYKAVIALLLASQDERASERKKFINFKGASDYFSDFQHFIRALVSCPEYYEQLMYAEREKAVIVSEVQRLLSECIRALFEGATLSKDLVFFVDGIIQKGREKQGDEVELHLDNPVASYHLALNYEALTKGMKPYTHIPLAKVLDALQDPEVRGYDPLLLQNIPTKLFALDFPSHHVDVLRVPTPTVQEYIDKAKVSEEFKIFLRSLAEDKPARKHLLFNEQDRTSWKEYARAHAIEEIAKKEEFCRALTVVTETKESEFYNQSGPYVELNQVHEFVNHLLEHFRSESSGYCYPEAIKETLFSSFAPKLIEAIWTIFFGKRNVLSRAGRMEFIELFYLFMQLKVIELVNPTSVSFTCKDGIDIGMTASCEIFYLLKLINARPLSLEEEAYMRLFLFGVPLLLRGRNLFSDRFSRLNSLVKLVETTVEEFGEKEFMKKVAEYIAPLYETKILNATLTIR